MIKCIIILKFILHFHYTRRHCRRRHRHCHHPPVTMPYVIRICSVVFVLMSFRNVCDVQVCLIRFHISISSVTAVPFSSVPRCVFSLLFCSLFQRFTVLFILLRCQVLRPISIEMQCVCGGKRISDINSGERNWNEQKPFEWTSNSSTAKAKCGEKTKQKNIKIWCCSVVVVVIAIVLQYVAFRMLFAMAFAMPLYSKLNSRLIHTHTRTGTLAFCDWLTWMRTTRAERREFQREKKIMTNWATTLID